MLRRKCIGPGHWKIGQYEIIRDYFPALHRRGSAGYVSGGYEWQIFNRVDGQNDELHRECYSTLRDALAAIEVSIPFFD